MFKKFVPKMFVRVFVPYNSKIREWRSSLLFLGFKKTRPCRFLLLESVVLDWFMVSSCLFRWSFTFQNLATNAWNRAETTKIKSDVLETPVILMPEILSRQRVPIADIPWDTSSGAMCDGRCTQLHSAFFNSNPSMCSLAVGINFPLCPHDFANMDCICRTITVDVTPEDGEKKALVPVRIAAHSGELGRPCPKCGRNQSHRNTSYVKARGTLLPR